MANPEKADDAKVPQNPVPTVSPNLPHNVVYVATPPPHVAPEPNETPIGGKFGIREKEYDEKAGKYVEKIHYVNAHGLPFSDDPAENLKEKASERKPVKPAI